MRVFLYISLLNLIISVCYAHNLEDDYTVNHYTKADGLPSNTAYGVTEDKDGFIWFCTDAGVVKFR